MKRPSRKASARILYVNGVLYGNPGNWAWVEDRDYIIACQPCRTVYGSGLASCPTHGPLSRIPARWCSIQANHERDTESLVNAYLDQTMVCSVYSHARRVSTAHPELLHRGRKAIPALLQTLADGQGGMHVMFLLGEITGEWPSAPADTPVADGHMVATKVDQASDLWLEWGREHKHLV